MVSTNIYEPDANVLELLEGNQNFVPSVPKGLNLSTQDWEQESFLRMLINHSELSVSKYFGKLPAYEYEDMIDWHNLKNNLKNVMSLNNDETLIIEDNKIVNTIKTNSKSPRVISLYSNRNDFFDLKEDSYSAYHKMQKQSLMSIGVQDLIEDNYLAFNEIANKNYYGTLDGRITVSSGFGHTGAAQALAVNMNHGVTVIIDMDRKLIEKMVDDGFCNILYEDIDSAFDTALDAKRNGLNKIIGLVGNASEVLWELINKGFVPNILTDRTNPNENYFPSGYSYSDSLRIKRADPHHYRNLTNHTIMTHVKAMLELQKRGSLVFEFGNGIREKAYDRGLDNAFNIPSIVPEYIFPVITSSKPAFKWIALSGETEDIFLIDDLILDEFSDIKELSRLIDVSNKVIFPKNIPSRKTRLEINQAVIFFRRINELIRSEEISAPILVDISYFKAIENNDTFKGSFFDPNNDLSRQETISKLIDENQGASWLSVNYYGNEKQYYNLTETIIVLDGSKEAEQNLSSLL